MCGSGLYEWERDTLLVGEGSEAGLAFPTQFSFAWSYQEYLAYNSRGYTLV